MYEVQIAQLRACVTKLQACAAQLDGAPYLPPEDIDLADWYARLDAELGGVLGALEHMRDRFQAERRFDGGI